MSVDVGAVRAAVEGEGALGMAVYAVCDELEALRAEVERLRATPRGGRESDVEWRTYSTNTDEHPLTGEHYEYSERTLFSGYVWCGKWRPFSTASTGQWWVSEGGYQKARVVWMRPCCLLETEDGDEAESDVADVWLFCEGCGCRKETARMRSFSDHPYCDECTSRY